MFIMNRPELPMSGKHGAVLSISLPECYLNSDENEIVLSFENKNNLLMKTGFLLVIMSLVHFTVCGQENFRSLVRPGNEPIASGKFQPTWESLKQFEVPDWFRNAKFGIWAHWGPQCQPGQGDWYARMMYSQGSAQYDWHVKNYGHPSKAGFKEVID